MANFDELLRKNKERLEKAKEPIVTSNPKKIARKGPTRPWQTDLPQYQTVNAEAPEEKSDEPQGDVNAVPIPDNLNPGLNIAETLCKSSRIPDQENLSNVPTPLNTSQETSSSIVSAIATSPSDSDENKQNMVDSSCKHSANLVETSCKPSGNMVDSLCIPSVNLVESTNSSSQLGKKGQNPNPDHLNPGLNISETYCLPSVNLVETSGKPNGNLVNSPSKIKSQPSVNLVESLGEPGGNPSGNPNGNMVDNFSLQINPLRTVQPKASFKILSKTQKTITYVLYTKCKSIREEYTESIPSKALVEACHSSINTVRSSVADLINLKIIAKRMFKGGPSGWTDYWINPISYEELAELESSGKLSENVVASWWIPSVNHGVNPGGFAPSSSSSFNSSESLKTTTTTDNLNGQSLPPDWEQIDCTPLLNLGVHFGQTQLVSLWNLGKLRPQEVQESIEAFAFDLRTNDKAKECRTGPLNYFMGILRKGPYTPPTNFETQEEQQLRLYLQAKRQQAEKRKQMEEEIAELEFQEWKSKLTPAQRRELAPHATGHDSPMQVGILKNYFNDHVRGRNQSDLSIPTGLSSTAEQVRAIADEALGPRS